MARFKGTQEDVKQIGRELGVRYILEGSVRKAENRVRISAQLIDSSTGFHLWAEDFDRDLNDVFAVQEETALKIADALNLRLTPQEQQAVRHRYTQDPERTMHTCAAGQRREILIFRQNWSNHGKNRR